MNWRKTREPQPKTKRIRIRHDSIEYEILLLDVLDRDGYRCRICGAEAKNRKGIHHVVFLSQGGSDTLRNMILLCLKCHDGFHGLAKYKGEIRNGKFVWSLI